MESLRARVVFIFIIGYIGGISFALTEYIYSIKLKAYPEDCSVCGSEIPPSYSSRIFPWMVSVRESHNSGGCGGSILDEYFILTAAHCVVTDDGRIKNNLKVYFETESTGQMREEATIQKFIPHPKYKSVHSNATVVVFAKYDIALLKLKEKINCNTYRRPVCLPSPDLKIAIGKASIISTKNPSDWRYPGILEGEGNYPTLKHLDFEKCIKPVPETEMIRDHTLCVGETNYTVCYGDSGSPLISKINSKFTAVGIVSAETNTTCSVTGPVFYTDVAKFVNWIEKERKMFLMLNFSQQGRKQKKRQRYPGRSCYKNSLLWKYIGELDDLEIMKKRYDI